jgi:hypothetical protein
VQQASFTTDSIRIGALPENELVLKGKDIGGFHVVIQRSEDGDGFTISKVGDIRLNGIPVSRAKLRQGDRIQIGSYELVVQSEEAFREIERPTAGDPLFLLMKKKSAV